MTVSTTLSTTRGAAGEVHRTALAAEPSPSVPAPIQFGISPRAVARQRNPKFESIPPVALRQERKVLLKISICVRSRSVQAKSRFKWKWRHATAPRAVEILGH